MIVKIVVVGAMLLIPGEGGFGQLGTPLAPASQSPRSAYGERSRDNENPLGSAAQEQIERGRQSERQKKLIADTDRLLALANELKIDMDKTTKDQMSIQVIHKAEEIEKLARSVKERMKG